MLSHTKLHSLKAFSNKDRTVKLYQRVLSDRKNTTVYFV